LIGEISELVMQDRQRLSQDGFIVALIRVNAKNNKLAGEPEIISRGFVPLNESSDLLQAARKEIKQQFQKNGRKVGQNAIEETLQNFFYRETQSRPVVLPSIIRV
jgi:ribonuclease J